MRLASFCAVTLCLTSVVPAQAAIFDVTGYWKASTDSTLSVLVERQFNSYRIGIVQKASNGTAKWYVVDGLGESGNSFSATGSTYSSSPGSSGQVTMAFSGSATGSLIWSGRTYPLVRDEFVPLGLAAPINPAGPETGWYSLTGSAGKPIAFVENQGSTTRVTMLGEKSFNDSGTGSTTTTTSLPSASVTASSDLTQISIASGSGAKAFTRNDFEDSSAVLQVADDQSAYSLPAALESKVVQLRGAGSMRFRSGLRERASAIQTYLANPGASLALSTATRSLLAFQCIRQMTNIATDSAEFDLINAVVDTRPKARLFAQFQQQLGTVVIGDQNVSPSGPNACTTFMQGLARTFSTAPTTSGQALRASPSTAAVEQQQATQDLRARAEQMAKRSPALASPTLPTNTIGTQKSCNMDEYVFLSGVGTPLIGAGGADDSAQKLKSKIAQSLGLSKDAISVKAIANPNPKRLVDIGEVLVDRFGIDEPDVTKFEIFGFSFFATTNPLGAAFSFVIGQLARDLIQQNAAASANIANILSADVAAGYRLILVPHSQGNILTDRGVDLLTSDTLKSVGLAAVASADNHVGGSGALGASTSATRGDDLVIGALRVIRSDTLGSTVFGAGSPKDASGHGFQESYLANPKAYDAILSRIKTAMNRAKYPQTGLQLGDDAGGFTGPSGQQKTYLVGYNVTNFDITYNMYTIPDAMDVFFRGSRIASTGGPVSGVGTLHVAIPLSSDDHSEESVDVIIYGTDPDTAWTYTVKCPDKNS